MVPIYSSISGTDKAGSFSICNFVAGERVTKQSQAKDIVPENGGLPRQSWAMLDQLLVSGANFAITLYLARVFDPIYLAAYGLGLSVALVLSNAYRLAFIVPLLLMDRARFTARSRRLQARHLVFYTLVVGIIAGCLALGLSIGASSFAVVSLLSALVCFVQLAAIDFERLIFIRLGRAWLSPAFSFGQLALVIVLGSLAYLSYLSAIAFIALTVSLTLTRFLVSVVSVPPKFHRLWRGSKATLNRSFGWLVLGSLSSTGGSHLPMFYLSSFAPTLNVAAYVAMRAPVQPLQIITRSLDLVDKLRMSQLHGNASILTLVRRRLVSLAVVSVAIVVATYLLSTQIILLLLGTKYGGFELTLTAWAVLICLYALTLPIESLLVSQGRSKQYALFQVGAAAITAGLAIPLTYLFLDLGAVLSGIVGMMWLLSAASYRGLIAVPALGNSSDAQ